MSGRLLQLALVACAIAHQAEAGCKKRRAPPMTDDEKAMWHRPLEQRLRATEMPANFSWLDVGGVNMVAPSWNQHIPQYCGSCWLHGSLSMIQDRLKIVKNGLGPDVMLARQAVLDCGAFHDMGAGCDGGDVIDVIRYMAKFGLPDESCIPYSATDHTKYGKKARNCPGQGYCANCMPIDDVDTCWSVKTPMRYGIDAYGQLGEPGMEPMMNEILARGPITCSMAAPDVFDYGYHGGIAVDQFHNSTEEDIDHDVEVVGWGVTGDGKQKYWIVRNSWGTFWGEMGFFKLSRGDNALRFEEGDCWWVVPTWEDEQDVRAGRKVGTMWGIMTPEEAAKVKPEAARKPHMYDPDVVLTVQPKGDFGAALRRPQDA